MRIEVRPVELLAATPAVDRAVASLTAAEAHLAVVSGSVHEWVADARLAAVVADLLEALTWSVTEGRSAAATVGRLLTLAGEAYAEAERVVPR